MVVLARVRAHWRAWPLLVKAAVIILGAAAVAGLVLLARGNTDYDACHRVYAQMDRGIHSGQQFADDYQRCTGINPR